MDHEVGTAIISYRQFSDAKFIRRTTRDVLYYTISLKVKRKNQRRFSWTEDEQFVFFAFFDNKSIINLHSESSSNTGDCPTIFFWSTEFYTILNQKMYQ